MNWRSCIACVSLAAVCVAMLCAAAHAGGKSEAQIRFEKGVSLFKAGDNVGALVEFKAAYEAEPNHKVRYNIGMTLFNLHRYVEAKAELQAYLAEGGKQVPADKKTEVQSLLYEIDSYIGTILVTSTAQGAILALDGAQVGPLPLAEPLAVDVGEHLVAVEAPGHLSWSQKVSVAGGKLVTVDAALTPSATAPQPAMDPSIAETPAPATSEEKIESEQGATCNTDPECGSRKSCHYNQCLSKQQWTNLKKRGKNLIIPGWMLFSVGAAGLVTFIAALGSDSGEVMIGAAPVGPIFLIPSIPLLAVGYKYRKLAKKKLALLDSPPLPWISPIDGGVAMGLTASF